MLPHSDDDSSPESTEPTAPHTPASFSAAPREVWWGEHGARIAPGRFTRMTLEVANGLSGLALSGGAPADDLVSFAFSDGPPRIDVDGDTIRVNRGRHATPLTWLADLVVHGVWGSTRIALGDAASWSLHLKGGASELRADLTDVRLDALEISGGANDVALVLPRPRGVVRVRMGGGASSVRIERPAGAAMAVRMKGGASELTFDEHHVDAAGGPLRFASVGFDDAVDRYEVEFHGGAAEVSVMELSGSAQHESAAPDGGAR